MFIPVVMVNPSLETKAPFLLVFPHSFLKPHPPEDLCFSLVHWLKWWKSPLLHRYNAWTYYCSRKWLWYFILRILQLTSIVSVCSHSKTYQCISRMLLFSEGAFSKGRLNILWENCVDNFIFPPYTDHNLSLFLANYYWGIYPMTILNIILETNPDLS